jgi:hypothetical protein
MNEEIALDPEVAMDINALRLIRAKVGFYNGRFVSMFPKNWYALAIQCASDGLKEPKGLEARKRAQELLLKLRDEALLPSRRQFNRSETWHENVLAAAQPFDMKISATPASGFLTMNGIEEENWPGGRAKDLPTATADNLLNALKPLLTQSYRFYLIDPYFDPRKFRDLFIRTLKMAFGEKKSLVSMTIIRSQNGWVPPPEVRTVLQAIMNDLGLPNKELRFCVAKDRATQFVLHDRCIMSEKGGVTLDNGLQTKNSLFPVGYIDKEVHEERWKRYAGRPFDVDEIVTSAECSKTIT